MTTLCLSMTTYIQTYIYINIMTTLYYATSIIIYIYIRSPFCSSHL